MLKIISRFIIALVQNMYELLHGIEFNRIMNRYDAMGS